MSLPSASTDPCALRGSYLGLGASLYMPATRQDLRELLAGVKLPGVRSLVVCTEDAVHPHAVREALANLRRALPGLGEHGPLRFLRPRDPEVLHTVARMPGAECLDGVCLPKLDAGSAPDWLSVLDEAPWLAIMPIVETADAFSFEAMTRLRTVLDPVRARILCLRIGGNDLLKLCGMRRPPDMTAYETPLRLAIDTLIAVFRPHGYELSAPVFDSIERSDLLARELRLDVAHGLFAKTAIHPAQVPVIEAAYAVSARDAALAEAVLDPTAAAVFRFDGQMAEPATHARWAAATRARLNVYGIAQEACAGVASA